MSSLLEAVEHALRQESDMVSYLTWTLTRIYGGMNGIIYRVDDTQSPNRPMVVKIRKRDERQRAQREFSVLQALKQASLIVAPNPISLHTDITTLPGDMVVSSWVEGPVLNDLSEVSFDVWERILTTLTQCHLLNRVRHPSLREAVLPIRSTSDVVDEVERRCARLPDSQIGEVTTADIRHLFDEFKRERRNIHPSTERIGLIVCDTNPSNMIDTQDRIVIVDWENAGWGDPAFDMADLLVRPNCAELSPQTRTKIVERYAHLMGDQQLIERILAYERLMLIFWLILTSAGLVPTDVQRFPGSRRFTREQSIAQQVAYLQRIEAARLDRS